MAQMEQFLQYIDTMSRIKNNSDARAFGSPMVEPILAAEGGPNEMSVGQRIVRACCTRLF